MIVELVAIFCAILFLIGVAIMFIEWYKKPTVADTVIQFKEFKKEELASINKVEVPDMEKLVNLQEQHKELKQLLENLPDMTEQEAKEALEMSLSKFNAATGDTLSLEDFLKDDNQSQIVPFIEIDDYNESARELQNQKEHSNILTDWDLVEELLGYHNRGYEMDGLVDIYKKLEAKQDLSQMEQSKLKQWYVLVGVELVYNV